MDADNVVLGACGNLRRVRHAVEIVVIIVRVDGDRGGDATPARLDSQPVYREGEPCAPRENLAGANRLELEGILAGGNEISGRSAPIPLNGARKRTGLGRL